MRRDRIIVILLAVSAGFFIAQMSPPAAIIGGAVCLWIIISTFIPEQENAHEHRHDPAHAASGSEPH